MTTVAFGPQTAPIDSILRDNAFSALRQLEVMESDDEVVITGIVPSYYLKQMAQESVRPALGGRRLQNRVRVKLNN
jgi:hypothetical protein